MTDQPPTFGDIRRSWITADNDHQVACYESINGRIPLTDLIDHLREVAPDVPLSEFGINYATVKWVESATEDERRQRAERSARQAERHDKWEHDTYERLKAKFEGGEAP